MRPFGRWSAQSVGDALSELGVTDLADVAPSCGGDLPGLELADVGGGAEEEAEVEVLVGGFVLGRVGVDGVDVDVERCLTVWGDEVGLDAGLLGEFASGGLEQGVVGGFQVPSGQEPLLKQAEAVLVAAEDSPLYAYLVVSLLTGGRTEEMRPLRWDHIDLDGDPTATPEIPPHIAVWRSVRSSGDTKTKKSRRTLALPGRAVDALKVQRERQGWQRLAAGDQWQETGLVFTSAIGTELDAANVRRELRKVLVRAAQMPGMDIEPHVIEPGEWTTRETRTSFVSILSDRGIPLEEISRLVGHSSTAVTEEVYRKQIRPVIQTGAVAMDGIFSTPPPPER